MNELEEFLSVINIPCDICGDVLCDGFCEHDREYLENYLRGYGL